MKLSRQLPLNALRVFEAVGRLMSFTRAGEELGMTQTAVSYQIRLLEEHIGEPLFWRRPRQIGLTETGQRLHPKVAEGFGLLVDAVQQARHTAVETLDILSIPTFATQWLARKLGEFHLEHPDIAVRLLRSNRPDQMLDKTFDVAIPWEDGPWPGMIAHPLAHLDFTPLLSPRLAASIGGVKEPADLLKLPVLCPQDPWWVQWFTAAGIDNPQFIGSHVHGFEAQDLEANAAMAGHGVAILSPFFFREELAFGRLIQPFPLTIPVPKPIQLVYAQGRRNARKIRAFHDWISAALEAEKVP